MYFLLRIKINSQGDDEMSIRDDISGTQVKDANMDKSKHHSRFKYSCRDNKCTSHYKNNKSEDVVMYVTFYLFFFSLYFFAGKISSVVPAVGMAIKLYDLTLPLITSLIVFSRRKSFPVLAILILYSICVYPILNTVDILSQVTSAVISSILYFSVTGKKGSVSFGRSTLTVQRIGWLVCFNALFYSLVHWWLILQLQLLPISESQIFSLTTLINIQWMMTSCITGIPFCYLVLRGGSDFSWFLTYLRNIKRQVSSGPKGINLLLWSVIIISIIYCLISTENDALIFSDYSLLWLLPVMLWGTICIGDALISPLWVIMLLLLSDCVDNYISVENFNTVPRYLNHHAFVSSMIFIFSLTIVTVGVLSARIRSYVHHLKRMSLSEFNTGLPNVAALKRDIKYYPVGGLCLIQCPELNMLTQTHGISFRFEYVKALAIFIKPLLQKNEGIYYTPGYGVLLRLNTVDNKIIDSYFQALSLFRFTGNNIEVGLNLGLAYMQYNCEIMDLPFIIGNLNASTFVSLRQGQPEVFLPGTAGDNIISPGVIRHILQKSIDQQSFMLVAQPIISTKNKPHYYEVLIRIRVVNNKIFFPDTFLPLARDAGLLADLDMAVIEQTFLFMQSREKLQSECRFSINITPQSLIKSNFMSRLLNLFTLYDIAPDKIVFEVIEADIIDSDTVIKNLKLLRKLGCKIAIDDFGTGASSYSRLKVLEADILKIDGSFIHNIVKDEFDRHTVMSFCEAAKLKKMEVVAEFVESEDIKKILTDIGVDWLQGFHTGKPIPIEEVRF